MMTQFPHKIIDLDNKGNIIENGIKTLYNLDESNSLTNWIKEPIKNLKNKTEYPNFKSGINILDLDKKNLENSLGCLEFASPSVMDNQMFVALYNGHSSLGGVSILPQNFLRCVSTFTARKVIDPNWLNQKDEYMTPNEQHPKFEQFQNDSIIYSLFNSSSQQTSLRNIQYHNKIWNIRNNFFWCSNSWIKALAELHNNEQVYNDLIQYPSDPYVYILLGQKMINRDNGTFSKTALQVLDKASKLLETTFEYRNEFNNEHPEYQVCNWDASYYQLKPMWKKYKEKEFKEFREIYLTFRDELKPLVYELGFLKE